jgi:hypothetical protein
MNPIKIPSTSQKKTNRLCCGTEASSQAEVVAQAADGQRELFGFLALERMRFETCEILSD